MTDTTTPPVRTLRRGRPSKYHFDTLAVGESRRYFAPNKAAFQRIRSAAVNYSKYAGRTFHSEWLLRFVTIQRVS